jgi:alpha-beta hydrolase superfamily lysophospholipase
MNKPSLWSDARGASRLVVDLTLLVTELVETMHHNIARRPGVFGQATFERTQGVTGLVYRSVRGVTHLVGGGIDAALAPLGPLTGGTAGTWPGRRTVIAALNGVLGDYLDGSHNPLALPMQLCIGGEPLALTRAGIAEAIPHPRTCAVVLVHGLCMGDLQWNRESHDHGEALARDLGANALYLRYNSGRHVSTNGTELAALLHQLVESWPIPLCELVLVGHSMGGLLIRSAYAAAESGAHRWKKLLRALVFVGTPHHGAPMERGGQGIDLLLAASPYTAAFTRLSRLRSAGITDLRHGSVLDSDWRGRDRFGCRADLRQPQPLPAAVPCFAIAGSLSKATPRNGRAARSDGLVPVASALGRHRDPRRDLGFAPRRQWVAYGTGHLDLLSSLAVHRQLQRWLLDEC